MLSNSGPNSKLYGSGHGRSEFKLIQPASCCDATSEIKTPFGHSRGFDDSKYASLTARGIF